ncbi:MAG: SHOCT domain-containing protein [Deltaproteobacteria bacterium]|nr:SHOCT domain-containing protein [Deltaproteobacteria bacterium]
MGMMDWGWPMHSFGWLFMLLFWALVVFGLIAAVRWLSSRSGGGGEGEMRESALDILKKRYARGEISKEEFERMKRDLE